MKSSPCLSQLEKACVQQQRPIPGTKVKNIIFKMYHIRQKRVKTVIRAEHNQRREYSQKSVARHHWLDGHESEWSPGVGDRQGGLAYCDSWHCKESDMTERLNWTEPLDWKRSVIIPVPRKGNAKECSNYRTIALISHTSKVMLKIL